MNRHYSSAAAKTVAVLLLLAAVTCSATEDVVARPVRVAGGHRWAFPLVKKMLIEFCEARDVPKRRFAVERWNDEDCPERFAAGDADILVHYALTDVRSAPEEGAEACTQYIAGQARAALIRAGSQDDGMSVAEVRDVLRYATLSDRKQNRQRTPIFGEHTWKSMSAQVLRGSCLRVDDVSYAMRRDVNVGHGRGEIIRKVRRNPGAVGTILWTGKRLPDVEAVPIAEDEDGPYVKPTAKPLLQKNYPLSEYVVLYVKPDAPDLAREFCEFAVSKEGSDIATEEGLFTPHRHIQHKRKRRVRRVRQGLGPEISGVTVGAGWEALRAMWKEYVRAEKAVQFSCLRSRKKWSAVRDFLGADASGGDDPERTRDRRDLLLLPGSPGEEAMDRYGEKWRKLAPERHELAARVVGIIVNPANELRSLTPGQVRMIFTGRVSDWRVTGGSGLSAPADGPVPIEAYGLHPGRPVSPVFRRRCLLGDKVQAVRRVNSTDRAVTHVSMNERAIAFVDFNRLPRDTDEVKILWMQVGFGEEARLVPPHEIPILGGAYPLAEKLYLYVHPQAGEAARGFAQFVATCGHSVDTVYSSAMEDMLETYRKNGLMPMERSALREILRRRVREAR
ncbi:MAG: substrate-binding domain-containing protein [Planctomycetota bacterium]